MTKLTSPQDPQAQIALAVQQAIAIVTGTNGLGLCWLYAFVGARVARHLFGKPYQVMGGSLVIQYAKDGRAFTFDAVQGGIDRYEFHLWFWHQSHQDSSPEIVDLAARHYKTWALAFENIWEFPDPPEYLWTEAGQLPKYLHLIPDRLTTLKALHSARHNSAVTLNIEAVTSLALTLLSQPSNIAVAAMRTDPNTEVEEINRKERKKEGLNPCFY